MSTRAEYDAAVAACPTPAYHETHHYCPSCPWTSKGWPFEAEPGTYETEAQRNPRPFRLERDEDVSGVSGTGTVAWGCEFPDGTAVLRWNTDWPTSVVWHDRGIEAVEHVHGHDGRTRIVRLEPVPPPLDADALKVAVCEYLLSVNRPNGDPPLLPPLLPPTAIDWLGNGIVTAVLRAAGQA